MHQPACAKARGKIQEGYNLSSWIPLAEDVAGVLVRGHLACERCHCYLVCGENLRNCSAERVLFHILDTIRKNVPFHAPNNPLYEAGSVTMLVLQKRRGRLVFLPKVAKPMRAEGGFLSCHHQHLTGPPLPLQKCPSGWHAGKAGAEDSVEGKEREQRARRLDSPFHFWRPGLSLFLTSDCDIEGGSVGPGGSGSIGTGDNWPGLSIKASQLQRPRPLPSCLPHPTRPPLSSISITTLNPPPSANCSSPRWGGFLGSTFIGPWHKRRGLKSTRDSNSSRDNLWEVSASLSSCPFLPADNVPMLPLASKETLLVPLQGHSFVPALGFTSPPTPATLDLAWGWRSVCQKDLKKQARKPRPTWFPIV